MAKRTDLQPKSRREATEALKDKKRVPGVISMKELRKMYQEFIRNQRNK
ncbi:MAG: hypothetical protein ACYS8I_06735 [Planctomycetota bacterium]|jgi:hypothetical protein